MGHFSVRALFALFILLTSSLLSAQETSTISVPNLIRYNSTVKSAQGEPLASATVGIAFAIYKQQDGGAPIWMETQNVSTDAAGNYSVLLGSTTAAGLPSDLFSQQEQRWLGIQVQGQAEQPRVLMVSVPYAFRAHEAETLGGKSVRDFVLANGATSTADSGNGGQAATSSAKAGAGSNGTRKGPANDSPDGPTNFSGTTTNQIVAVTQSGTGRGLSASAASEAIVSSATGAGGIGIVGQALATSGSGIGLYGSVASSSGIAAVFTNNAGGKILSGQNHGTEKFSVDGSGDVNASTYQIAGIPVLSSPGTLDFNLFVGLGAGSHNVTGTGTYNAFLGTNAGNSNTTGGDNTFTGAFAGNSNTTGINNTFVGNAAGYNNQTGNQNTFTGEGAGYNTTSGNNIFIGYQAGYNNFSGTNDIYIGSIGPASGTESTTMRIGNSTTAAAFIAGIYGANVSGVPVQINSNGRLGAQTSSRRFKDHIQDMGNSTGALMKLRPVTFFYKPEYSPSEPTLEYGLIAEEVAEIYPELVAYDNDGNPYTVRYQYLAPMLLNEVQKQYRRAEQQSEVIAMQQQEIKNLRQQLQLQNADLQERLQKLERLVGQQLQAIAQK